MIASRVIIQVWFENLLLLTTASFKVLLFCMIIFLIIWEMSKNMTKTIHETPNSMPCFFHEWFINSQFNLCCDSDNRALLDLFISSDSSIYSTIAFLHSKILIMLLSQFPLTFQQIQNRMPCFIAQLMAILVLIGIIFVIRDVPWEDSFKLSTSAAASEFCEWLQVVIEVCISHCK